MKINSAVPLHVPTIVVALLLGSTVDSSAQQRHPSVPDVTHVAPAFPSVKTGAETAGERIPSYGVQPATVSFSEIGQRELTRRNHFRGALIGAGTGAVVGGVGFAAVTYFANAGEPGADYWPLGLMVGSAGGGVAGMVIGGIIGVER